MKNILFSVVFVAALTAGVGLSSGSVIFNKIDNIIHRNCVRWGEETQERSLFTFQELKPLLGKEVIYNNLQTKNKETGRIISVMPIKSDKYMISIYIGNGTEDHNSRLLSFSKEDFYKRFEIVD